MKSVNCWRYSIKTYLHYLCLAVQTRSAISLCHIIVMLDICFILQIFFLVTYSTSKKNWFRVIKKTVQETQLSRHQHFKEKATAIINLYFIQKSFICTAFYLKNTLFWHTGSISCGLLILHFTLEVDNNIDAITEASLIQTGWLQEFGSTITLGQVLIMVHNGSVQCKMQWGMQGCWRTCDRTNVI